MPQDWLTPERVTILGLAFLAIAASSRRIWVWGSELKELKLELERERKECEIEVSRIRKERDFWIDEYRKNQEITAKSLYIGEQLTRALERIRGS